MGCHSTLFGPVKYSILPQHLAPRRDHGRHRPDRGRHLPRHPRRPAARGRDRALGGGAGRDRRWPCSASSPACSMPAGAAAAGAVPDRPQSAPRAPGRCSRRRVTGAASGCAILGISWFFAVGAVLLTDFAPLVSGTLGGRQEVVTLFLLVFSVSIALGSLAVNRLLAGEVSARYVPVSALFLAGFMIDLWLSTGGFRVVTPGATISAVRRQPGQLAHPARPGRHRLCRRHVHRPALRDPADRAARRPNARGSSPPTISSMPRSRCCWSRSSR